MLRLETVLYVDDDADMRALAELALGDIGGLNVGLCADGRQAAVDIRASGAQLLLLDVVMPGLDGPGTLAAVRADGIHIPVIFVTAQDTAEEQARLMGLGALGIIPKPLDLMGMATQVRDLWQRQGGGLKDRH